MEFCFSETSSNNKAPVVDCTRGCSNRGVRRGRWQCLQFIVTDKTVLKMCFVDCVWNVMAHAQKPDFVNWRKGRVHLLVNRRGRQFSRLLADELCASTCRVLYCSCKPVFCSHVTLTGYPLHSLGSPSLLHPVRHRVPSHFNWTLPTAYKFSFLWGGGVVRKLNP